MVTKGVLSPHSLRRTHYTGILRYWICVLTAALRSSIGRITAILISRFLLELQEANQVVVRLDPGDPLHSSRHPYDSTPTFISSLAGFVNPALSEAQSEDHDDDGCELQIRSRSEHGEEEREVLAESCQAAASSSA